MIGGRMVIHGENPTNDILIYIYSKCQGDLLSNAWDISEDCAVSFQQQHKSDPDLGRSALASVRHFGENNSRYFRGTKARWKANSVDGFTVIAMRTSRRGTISNAQVRYQSVNGDGSSHSVWMNVAGLTAKTQLPVTPVFSIYGEGGLAILTRKGFQIDQSTVLKDANYATLLIRGGVQYRVTANWNLVTGIISASHESGNHEPLLLRLDSTTSCGLFRNLRSSETRAEDLYFRRTLCKWDITPMPSVMASTISFQKTPCPCFGPRMYAPPRHFRSATSATPSTRGTHRADRALGVSETGRHCEYVWN